MVSATINPSLADKVERHVDRIGRLDTKIAEALAQGKKNRVTELQVEKDRRQGELDAVRKILNG
jgi:hypothetical protein